MDLVIMGEERGVVSSKCNAANGGCSHLCLLAPNPEHYTCACPIGIKLMEDSKTCRSSPAVWLAVAHRKQIRQISLDMPYLVDIVMPFPPLSKAVAIDYDRKTGDIYWSDTVEDVIKKARPDGSGYETVVFDGLENVDGIAIDSAGRKLYWTDAESNSIQVCWLANCAEMRRALAWIHLDNPRAICLDYDLGLLFWSDWGNQPRIEQSDMDGNNRMTLISERLVWPNGLAVYRERMYWTDAKLGTIETAPLSNTLNRSILLRSLSHPYALVVLNDHIYWTDWKTQAIHRADRHSGNHTTAIVSNLDGLMDLRAIQPKELDPDVCGDNNGGCSHLCLRSPKGFTCTCPTGITLLEDGMTCRKQPKAFLLCAVKNSLVRISLDTPEMFDVKMPTPGIQKAVSVDFHWNKSALYYLDAQLNAVRGVSMDDPVRTWDVLTNLTAPDCLAVDWIANNIYWTDLERKTIEVAKLTGFHKKVITSELEEPRSLALYPQRGFIFWTDWGESPRIERSYMDGSDRKVIVQEELKFPNGLSIDFHAEKLYWADALKDRIEMSELNGHGRTQLIPEATNPFGLTQHGDHIYWMDWNKKGVERAEASTGRERTILKARVHGVLEIKAVAKERQLGTNPCAVENGHCTHFCFYRGRHGYVCSCPDSIDTSCSIKPSSWVPNSWHPEDGDESTIQNGDNTLASTSLIALLFTTAVIAILISGALSVTVCLIYHRKQRQKKYNYPGGRMNFSDYSETKGDNQSKAYLWNKLRYDKSQERVFAVGGDKGGDIVSLIPVPVSPALSTTPTSSIALENNDRSTSIR